MPSLESEHSWHLLFDIALGYGEWLCVQHLSHKGFLTFLENAQMLGAYTSIYSILIERLWRMYCEPYKAVVDKLIECKHTYEESEMPLEEEKYSRECDLEEVHAKLRLHELSVYGVITFDGFTRIMNVLSVRCWQVAKCEKLSINSTIPLSEALTLSDEEHVHLRESVEYTAEAFFTKYIEQNTIHCTSRISLNSHLNKWSTFTNHVIAHIFTRLMEPVIKPLFYRFARESIRHITEKGYIDFLSVIVPERSALQHAVAMSAFHCPELETFTDICSRLSLANSNESPIAVERALGLESFLEVLLMLSVLVYSDTVQYPHHVAITAKVWSFCQQFLCPACKKEMCRSDPLFAISHTTRTPTIASVYPSSVQLSRNNHILINGSNFQLDIIDRAIRSSENVIRQTLPQQRCSAKPRIKQSNTLESSRANISSLQVAKCAADLFNDHYNNVSEHLNSRHNCDYNGKDSNEDKEEYKIVLRRAKLEYEELEKLHFLQSEQNTLQELELRMENLIDVTENTEIISSQYMLVSLPATLMCQSEQFRHYIAMSSNTTIILVPYQLISISLENNTSKGVSSHKTVLIKMEESTQTINPYTIAFLRSMFQKNSKDNSFMELEQFAELSATTGLVEQQSAMQICRKIVHAYNIAKLEYKLFAEETHTKEVLKEEMQMELSDNVRHLSFDEYICCTVMLCMTLTQCTSATVSDVLFYFNMMRVYFSDDNQHKQKIYEVPLKKETSTDTFSPYDALLEVPYQLSLNNKQMEWSESIVKRNNLLEEMHDNTVTCHTCKDVDMPSDKQTSKSVESLKSLRPLPDYPSSLRTEPIVTQYAFSSPEVGLESHLAAMHVKLRDAFLLKEVAINDDEYNLSM